MADKQTREVAALLHRELAERLLEDVRKGKSLGVARQFLRDNGIDDAGLKESPIRRLAEELPFSEEPPQDKAG